MLPFDGDTSGAGAAGPPMFDITLEWPFPRARFRCLLIPHDDRVDAIVNTAHGRAAYEHAAYHAHHMPVDGPCVCYVQEPCDYPGADGRC